MRKVCLHCRRPEVVCVCRRIPRLESRTRVVFLQHPRERYVAVGTARMAHLALPNSEFHLGVHFEEQPQIQALVMQPSSRTAVLFPGPEAVTLETLGWVPETLLVLDGTWTLAHKLLKANPSLQRLPRLGFTPKRPGNYRIRKEPSANCLSTIEAVAEILGEIEGHPGAFDAMLRPFEYMVEQQLAHIADRTGPRRFRRPRGRERRIPPWRVQLEKRARDVVLVYCEANIWGRCEAQWYPAELLQWVAVRPSTGGRFSAFARPQNPIGPNTARHLEVSPELIFQAPPRSEGMAAFASFVRPSDLLVGWGHWGRDFLREAGATPVDFLDLRIAAAEFLQGGSRGVENAAEKLRCAVSDAWAPGRAGRRIVAMEKVLAAMLSPPASRQETTPPPDARCEP